MRETLRQRDKERGFERETDGLKERQREGGRERKGGRERERGIDTVDKRKANKSPFDRMFCAAPIRTASISGVVPSLAVIGTKKLGKRVKEKKAAPTMLK